MQIGIIDYGDRSTGSGNLNSINNSLLYIGAKTKFLSNPEEILKSDKIILPGVGATSHMMKNLKSKNLDNALKEAVFKKGTPLLGICAGMQIMATNLTEFGNHEGLGWIKGKVVNLKKNLSEKDIIPHMGWSEIILNKVDNKLKDSLKNYKSFYFSHSYSMLPHDINLINSFFEYGNKKFVAGVSFENVFAVQFHPEKSQISGQNLLKWFLNWKP